MLKKILQFFLVFTLTLGLFSFIQEEVLDSTQKYFPSFNEYIPDSYYTIKNFFQDEPKKEEVKVNIGCQDLLEAIPRIGCKAVLFGHIHESYGRYTDLSGVQYINAAVLDEQYELTHQPMVIDV